MNGTETMLLQVDAAASRFTRPERCWLAGELTCREHVVVSVRSPVFVAVSGPPASGKSTLAIDLACELALPRIAKDTIKDALMSVLPVPDVAASQYLGRAAVAAMLAVASDSPIGAVIDCNFHRSVAAESLGQLPGVLVEVFCRCDRARAWERYRARSGSRHPGHFDTVRTIDDLWHDDVAQPVAGGWPVVQVDTNEHVDIAAVLDNIRRSSVSADRGTR